MIFTKFTLAAVAMMAGVMANPTPVEPVAQAAAAPSVLAAINANLTLAARDVDHEKRQAGAGIHLVNCGVAAGDRYSIVLVSPSPVIQKQSNSGGNSKCYCSYSHSHQRT